MLPTVGVNNMSNMTSPIFQVYRPSAQSIFGDFPKLELLHQNDVYPFAHEGPVYANDSLYMTSNMVWDPTTGQHTILISRLFLPRDGSPMRCEEIHATNIPMPNGAVRYKDGIVFCAQGNFTTPGGLVFMKLEPPYETEILVESSNFTSPNDVVVYSDGSLLFTDPIYGYEQLFRPTPAPDSMNKVYRYDPSNKSVSVVAEGFGRPNGLAFNPNMSTLYVTDTDRVHGDGTIVAERAADIIAFDVKKISNGLSLSNRRHFARAECGIPDGIKCDTKGHVYSGCGDGVNIWSPEGGDPVAKIVVEGGVANFCFGRDGEMFLLNEHKLWRAQLAPTTKGARYTTPELT